ncbi:MAG: S-methyl-5-thioribose-1-phosphate isomerase [Anaerolineae bacterium]|nr:S-methyl-5-thioribose-1-phosphate isomerase [Anaerolineae bacterium]
MRTLEWDDEKLELLLIDQRLLPDQFEIFVCRTYQDVVVAIRDMIVRGAPAIGAAAAFGMALAVCRPETGTSDDLHALLRRAAGDLLASRPTAVNLAWGVQRMLKVADDAALTLSDISQRLIAEAKRIAEEDVETNKRMAVHGAALIQDGDTIIHHCNTGSLATVDWGTALGVIRMAHENGKRVHVLVDETRPRLQGARLTAWELEQYRIPYEIICDNAAGYFLRTGRAQKVFFGADRVAANGDVANKVGSYMLALAAHANDVPVFSVFPTTTVDLNLEHGDLIPIEERDCSEVLNIQIDGKPVTPKGAKARNPAFDVTPNHLLTALVTEKGVIYPPFWQNLPRTILET